MELEIKAILTKEQFVDLITKNVENVFMPELKVDTYYSKYKTREERKANKEPLYRLRSKGNTESAVFTRKVKNIIGDTEQNIEEEFSVTNKSLMEKFILENGFVKWFEKRKICIGWMETLNEKEHNQPAGYVGDKPFGNLEPVVNGHVEVEIVNDNIYAVEVEVITPANKNLPKPEFDDFFVAPAAAVPTMLDNYPDNDKVLGYIRRWFVEHGLENNISEKSWVDIINEQESK